MGALEGMRQGHARFMEGSPALISCHQVHILSVSLFSWQPQALHSRNCHFKLRTSRTTNSQEKSAIFQIVICRVGGKKVDTGYLGLWGHTVEFARCCGALGCPLAA